MAQRKGTGSTYTITSLNINYTYMILIGIDPAFRENGFAVCTILCTKKEVRFEIMKDFKDFLNFANFLHHAYPRQELFICVENSNLQKASFDTTGSKLVVARKSRNVGMNQAISQIVVDTLKAGNYKVKEVSPLAKGTKWDHKTTQAIMDQEKYLVINYKGLKTEQDKRDAFKLALLNLKFV